MLVKIKHMKKIIYSTIVAIAIFSACKKAPQPTEVIKEPETIIAPAIVDTVENEEPEIQEETKTNVVNNLNPNDKYFIVVGSFLNKTLANKYVEQLNSNGKNGIVITRYRGANTEFHRVACQSFTDKNQALSALETERYSTPNAWILIK